MKRVILFVLFLGLILYTAFSSVYFYQNPEKFSDFNSFILQSINKTKDQIEEQTKNKEKNTLTSNSEAIKIIENAEANVGKSFTYNLDEKIGLHRAIISTEGKIVYYNPNNKKLDISINVTGFVSKDQSVVNIGNLRTYESVIDEIGTKEEIIRFLQVGMPKLIKKDILKQL